MYNVGYLNSSNQLISYINGNVICENVKNEPMQGYTWSISYFMTTDNNLYYRNSSSLNLIGENVKYYYSNAKYYGYVCNKFLTTSNEVYNFGTSGSAYLEANDVKTLYEDGTYITNDNKISLNPNLNNVIDYIPEKQQAITSSGKYYQGYTKVLDSGMNWYQDETGEIYYYAVDPNSISE